MEGHFVRESGDVWLDAARESSRKQYESSWTALLTFLREKDVSLFNREAVAAFMRFYSIGG